MSSASRASVALLSAVALSLPIIGFAALDVGVDSSGKEKANTQDSCKTGSIESSKGQVTGGGREYDNVIYMYKEKVVVMCRPVQPGETGRVVYCRVDSNERCKVLSKDSQEGKNLIELHDNVRSVGAPNNDTYRADPRDVLNAMVNKEEMDRIDSYIGRPTFPKFGTVTDYSTVLGLAAEYSAPENLLTAPNNSYRESVAQAIDALAQPARMPVVPNPYSDMPINIDPSIRRDWSKPNIVDFLDPWDNAVLMNELYWRQKNDYNANQRVQNTFEDLLLPPPAPPVLASAPPENTYSPGWFTRTYDSFINFLFGK